jgi:hypothetical protein
MTWRSRVGLLLAGLTSPLAGGASPGASRASDAARRGDAGAARALIRVDRGEYRSVKRAIEEYAKLRTPVKANRHRVSVYRARGAGSDLRPTACSGRSASITRRAVSSLVVALAGACRP